ncbi:MAG: hypothetical protein FXF49_08500 [Flexistipes sinusarabici]|uniref:Uncharacterized protein n=1 Tax=Flexistipes sinusarabici TaxID=2352 RepID=A0A5D0MJ72_FLESI|nr:hypothetical protein [Flexistipes sinusarabici]TYB33026.1 MAG: hypothetical protein FXF49_08500 [Flexistipes sinusarabici]
MLRKIIRPHSEEYKLHIPKEYVNKEVEILVLPLFESNSKESILETLANGPTYEEEEITEWEKSIEKGYENWEIELS